MERYELLERRWAEWNNLNPAGMVACSSGTAALHLAFEALELPRGSHVVMSDYNMVACPRAAVMAGLTPVFVDCDWRLTIDPHRTHEALPNHDGTATVLATHVYGRSGNIPDLINLWKVLENRKVRIVEDLAEAHGVKPQPCSSAACWSFYKNKVIGGEEGGAVWFCNPLRAKLARKLRCLGFTGAHDYTHVPRGHNYRLANCLAEKILVSLDQVDENLKKRREIEAMHDQRCPPAWRMPERQVPWVYDLRVPGMDAETQTDVVMALRDVNIQARHGFKPMTWQREFYDPTTKEVTKAGRAATEVIYLPLSPDWYDHREQHVSRCWDIINREISSIPQETDQALPAVATKGVGSTLDQSA